MPLAMSAEQVNHTRQLLVAKGVPPPVADEVIEIVVAQLSKEDDADAAKTKLEKIANNLASQTLGASDDPDRIANHLLGWVVKGGAMAIGAMAVSEGKSIIEEVAGSLGEAVKAVRDLFKDSARRPPARGSSSLGPADTNHPAQPSGPHTSGHGHHTSGHHPTRPARGHCSFCGKSQSEVRKLIGGPSVFICNECVVSCCTLRPLVVLPLPGKDLNREISAPTAPRSRARESLTHLASADHCITQTTHDLRENCQCSFCGRNHPYLMNKPISDPPVFICKQCMRDCGHIIFSGSPADFP